MSISQSCTSKTAYADAILNGDLDPEARKQIVRLRDQWAADEEMVTRRPGVCKRLNCKPTHGRDLERANKIDSFLAGSIRLIHVSSIYEYLIKQVLASHPLNAPPLKAPGGVYMRAAPQPQPLNPPHVQERAAAQPAPTAKRRHRRPRKSIPELSAVTAE